MHQTFPLQPKHILGGTGGFVSTHKAATLPLGWAHLTFPPTSISAGPPFPGKQNPQSKGGPVLSATPETCFFCQTTPPPHQKRFLPPLLSTKTTPLNFKRHRIHKSPFPNLTGGRVVFFANIHTDPVYGFLFGFQQTPAGRLSNFAPLSPLSSLNFLPPF